MTGGLEELYRDILMDHYKFPRGKKIIPQADIVNEGQNPLCGDSLSVNVSLDKQTISDIGISCVGCAICSASSSMLAEILEGKTLAEVKEIAQVVKKLIKGEEYKTQFDLGDISALEGVRKFPVRIKCALLAWTTLIDGIAAWEKGKQTKVSSTE